MLRILVDSGSSIKQFEKNNYGVDIIPLLISLNEANFQDGIDLTNEIFYKALIEDKIFPKTSLPLIKDVQKLVDKYTELGDDIIILPISSGISGTYNVLRLTFEDYKNVKVIDSKLAVGGVRLLVEEINRNKNLSLDEIEEKINNLIPRVRIMAIPETLEYLHRGGRLSTKDFILGSVLSIKPIIGFDNGKVVSISKKRGLKSAMQYIINALEELECDMDYPIIASYTYNKVNVDKLIENTPSKYLPNINIYDDLASSIAAHWGPNAFGYIFVSKK